MGRRKTNSRTQRRNQHRASDESQPAQRQKASRRQPVPRAPRLSSLSPSQLKKRADVFAAHADMLRNPELRASQVAKDRGITVTDFWAYAPKAFKRDSRGHIRAVADRYVRRMEIPGPDGPIVVKIKGSKSRREIARFRNDVFAFLGGNASALEKWKGVKIQGHELLTDPQIIRLLGEQDNLPEHFGSEQVIPYSRGNA